MHEMGGIQQKRFQVFTIFCVIVHDSKAHAGFVAIFPLRGVVPRCSPSMSLSEEGGVPGCQS
ncbi:hypothetical protein D3876_08270 [Sphingomonas cavernae]|uniref:Uncharacterized protein n=1 Tax=Sphingomonas cavernae TaxID=2320861 RepID=A0A418WJN7_9SPHN|nr:hypothetical protein D3876_08270 [Sphingomonas cavernae]